LPKTTKSANHPIRKVLIANRGEIALRIQRACREKGIATVAVYSDADRAALHVLQADEAYHLGPSPATESYLRGDLILEIAQRTGADAIHPGYGFLAENAGFAETCAAAKIIFIGPPARAMRMLGSKTQAREVARKAGMPCVPGSTKGLKSVKEAMTVARDIGYPIMLKAAAGGGGKGIREVAAEAELASAYAEASSEGERAFGDGELYIEKRILQPRHIEMQLIADHHGHCIYLGERECSVQRRHQKVIEESPSPVVGVELRRRMGEAAVKIALAAGYTNAGTVEFLVDDEQNFYFLEMNTRLQVEHPVTEMVTGFDLVHMQLLVAEGWPLPVTQKDVHLRGHAIECRIYAEDPDNNFFPSPGLITRLIQPGGPGLREDCGVYEGWRVPLEYDPMLSKLIAFAPTRAVAIDRMIRALDEYFIGGIATNISLFRRILEDPAFRSGRIDTSFLEKLLSTPQIQPASEEGAADPALLAALAAAIFEAGSQPAAAPAVATAPEPSAAWKSIARSEALRA